MSSVKVAVRVRPYNDREKKQNSSSIINMDGKSLTTIKNPVSYSIKTKSSLIYRKMEKLKSSLLITATGLMMASSRRLIQELT